MRRVAAVEEEDTDEPATPGPLAGPRPPTRPRTGAASITAYEQLLARTAAEVSQLRAEVERVQAEAGYLRQHL